MPGEPILPFSPEEVAAIQAMLKASNATVVCPRCRGALTFTTYPTGAEPQAAVWELLCGSCKRKLVVGGGTRSPERG